MYCGGCETCWQLGLGASEEEYWSGYELYLLTRHLEEVYCE